MGDNNKMILTQDSATTTATVDLHNEVVEENIKQKPISSTSSEELLTTSTTTVTTVTNNFSSSSESLQVDNRKVNKSSLTDQLLSAVKAATDKKEITPLTEELKSVVKSGILDLGVLGLWSKDIELKPTFNQKPRPVYQP